MKNMNRLIMSVALCGAMSVQASLFINFDDYTAAQTIVGQPGTGSQWSKNFGPGNNDGLQIVDTGGGNNVLQFINTAGTTNNNIGVNLSPTDSELGFVFDGASSVVTTTYEFFNPTALNGSPTLGHRIRIGAGSSGGAVDLTIFNNGQINYKNGATDQAVTGAFTASDTFTVSVTADYSSKTWGWSLDGSPVLGTSAGVFNFTNSGETVYSLHIANVSTAAADTGSGFIDLQLNGITAIPEPSTFALVGISLLAGFLGLRRRR